jgi:hypothetical protein
MVGINELAFVVAIPDPREGFGILLALVTKREFGFARVARVPAIHFPVPSDHIPRHSVLAMLVTAGCLSIRGGK